MIANSGKRVIVAGATGSVGQLVVKVLLTDPRVDHVTAVVRKTSTLWDSNKLSQLVVDFDDLHKGNGISNQNASIRKAFEHHDAFMTALGVYSGSVKTEEEMETIENFNVMLGYLAAGVDVPRGAYLSGAGVKQPWLEGRASSMFARCKGQTEESLAKLFPLGHVSCRPAAIFDRPGPPAYGFVDGYLMKTALFQWFKNTSVGISAPDIAKGMVQGAVFDDEEIVKGNVVWENHDVKEAARRYEEVLDGKLERKQQAVNKRID